MKKIVFTFVLSLFAVVVCVFAMDDSALSASAVNDFSIAVERLTEAETSETQAGDFKVTLSIANNSGFAAGGFSIGYDKSNFSVVTFEDEGMTFVEYTTPSQWYITYTPSVDATSGKIGVSFLRAQNTTRNGEMISFYLRHNTGSSSMTPVTALVFDELRNISKDDLSYTVSPIYEVSGVHRIGDVNCDRYLDISDPIYILRTIDNANGVTVTAENYLTYYPAYEAGDYVCSFEAMDINDDGVLTEADSTAIQQYLTGQTSAGVLANYTNTCYVISTTAPAATA